MKKHFSLSIILILICSMLLTSCNYSINDGKKTNALPKDNKELRVHFIDVGQGDAMLIQLNGYTLLIDAGPEASYPKLKSYLDKNGIYNFDYVIATHPHEDHIGGMPELLKQYSIKNVYGSKVINNTDNFKCMVEELKNKKLKIQVLRAGSNLKLGDDAILKILSPTEESYKDMNNYSVVVKLEYKKVSFLFMGDAETEVESKLLLNKTDVTADVLKIGHHGSNSSTSEEFLKAVSPKYAVISCGKNNDYGHPHKETIEKLKQLNIKYFRTDENGNILITSDGETIKTDQER